MDPGSSRMMLSSVVTAHQLGGPLRLPHVTERTELLDPRLDVEHRRPGHRIEPGDVNVQTVHRYEPAPRHPQSVGATPAALGKDPYRRLVLMSRHSAGTPIDVFLRHAVEEEDDFKVRKLPQTGQRLRTKPGTVQTNHCDLTAPVTLAQLIPAVNDRGNGP